jgi:large subunit ribosomal protein L24
VKLKIKKGATVQVISGSDKGKTGKVIEIKTEPLKIKVHGVKVQTHFDKKEGILKKEGFIDYSNVKLVAASDKVTKKKAKKNATKNTTKNA